MEVELIPLISPLSREYYELAFQEGDPTYYNALDLRLCLEKICDDIIVGFVSKEDQENWKGKTLHKKLKASESFLDKGIVNRLIKAKNLGNDGVHKGKKRKYSKEEMDAASEAILDFSLEVFVSYFRKNGFPPPGKPWILTLFSSLPPVYRVRILERYYAFDQSILVIDKLAMAYLKNEEFERSFALLLSCRKKEELSDSDYISLVEKMILLIESFDRLPISASLEVSRGTFNELRDDSEERDAFVCLMSMILNG